MTSSAMNDYFIILRQIFLSVRIGYLRTKATFNVFETFSANILIRTNFIDIYDTSVYQTEGSITQLSSNLTTVRTREELRELAIVATPISEEKRQIYFYKNNSLDTQRSTILTFAKPRKTRHRNKHQLWIVSIGRRLVHFKPEKRLNRFGQPMLSKRIIISLPKK